LFKEGLFIADPINTTPKIILFSIIYHIQYMFRLVITAIVG